MKKVGLLFTDYILVDYVNDLLKKEFQDIIFLNFVDDYLLYIVGNDMDEVYRRLEQYYKNMENMEVDLIINICTSISPYVPKLRKKIKIPILTMEEPLLECVRSFESIGIIATIHTALSSMKSSVIVEDKEIIEEICEGAFQLLKEKRNEEHDEAIIKKVYQLENKVDVVVLAQASMNRAILECSNEFNVPILGLITCMIDKLKEWENV